MNMTTNNSDKDWLLGYLDGAIEQQLCTTINCTTCGSLDFRNGLLEAFVTSSGKTNLKYLNIETAQSLAKELATLNPPQESRHKYESVFRFIIYDLWRVFMGTARDHLGDSFAGDVYDRMGAHYQARLEEQRCHEEMNDPEKAKQRREEKKRLRQEKHQERLESKKERDRIWWSKQK